jgi:alanine dehydrogenase
MAGEEFAVEPVSDLGAAARQSDVIVTCTTARDPFLLASFVAAGTFIAAVGADSPDKSEIDPRLTAKALVVVDVLDQCAMMGDLRLAFASGLMTRGDVHAELGDLVAGRKAGRTSDAQVILFDSTGTALQDVAAAASIYQRASRTSGLGSIDLGAAA